MEKSSNTPLIIIAIVGLALSGLSLQDGGTAPISTVSSPQERTFEGKQLSATEIEREIDIAKRRAEELGEEIKEATEALERSEYYGLVSLQFFGGFRTTDPGREYVSISATSQLRHPISLSGWKLVSDITGKGVPFPKATNLYYPGVLTEESNPILFPQGKVIVVTGKSPVGISFRVNICSGYLNQFNSFNPWMQQQCPRVKDEDLSSIPLTPKNDNCFDYIDSIPSCQIPNRPLTPAFSPECADFIQKTPNYKGCVDIHRNDSDFYTNEWRIYLQRDERLWRDKREKLRLLDASGKTVLTYTRQ